MVDVASMFGSSDLNLLILGLRQSCWWLCLCVCSIERERGFKIEDLKVDTWKDVKVKF